MGLKNYYKILLVAVTIFLHNSKANSQQQPTIKISASSKYVKSKLYKKLWGEHYREAWHIPVSAPVVNLDTLKGGLTVYELGGSRQTKSLKAIDKNGREYVLRSVDKTFGNALSQNFRGTFLENIANDQVTFSNPYSALIVAPMADAVGILHTNPQLVYVPHQPALKNWDSIVGNSLYILEERPDENWETANFFANATNIISTEKMLEKISKKNNHIVDQALFVRSRLFDFFIADWGRHEDQWRWAETKENGITIYKPIPRDRDNAFTKLDGLMLKNFAPKNLQGFNDNLKNVEQFAFTGRFADRRHTASLTLNDWQNIAKDMQAKLTDRIIIAAVESMPIELHTMLKKEYVQKLQNRREDLVEWATAYYQFINSQGVDIVGSKERELFVIHKLDANETKVSIFRITDDGQLKESQPYYTRSFYANETKEIRLFGLGGNDNFEINGKNNDGTKIIIIGENESEEKIINNVKENSTNKNNIVFYDDKENTVEGLPIRKKLHDSNSSTYRYNYYKYDKKGFKPELFYSRDDRFYIGIGYNYTKNKWNKEPYWQKHNISARYSLNQGGYSITYKSTFVKTLGNWNINTYANYDKVRWLNFFGLGNNTNYDNKTLNYYRYRYSKLSFEPSVEKINNNQRVKFGLLLNKFEPIVDSARFVAKTDYYNTQANTEDKWFTGLSAEYVYQSLNDSILPTKGLGVQMGANYLLAINNQNNGIVKPYLNVTVYLPITSTLGVSIKSGASTLLGNSSEFYLYNTIGGTQTLRGFLRERFTGKTTFYTQQELRWIGDVHSHLYKGKIGVFGFYDIGKVWMPNETNHLLHHGYGGGLILSPFNKITFLIAQGISNEAKPIHLSLVKYF